jgi:N-methylhydantoinase A
MQGIFDELQQRATTELQQEGFVVDSTTTSFTRELDVRYAGQGFELRVPVAGGRLEQAEKARVTTRFNELHRRQRGHSAEAEPLEVVSYRLRAEVQVPQYQPRPATQAPIAQPAAEARAGDRRASFGRTRAPLATPIWRREHLAYGNVIRGPAIVEQLDATTVIPPDWTGELDAYGNLILVHRGAW